MGLEVNRRPQSRGVTPGLVSLARFLWPGFPSPVSLLGFPRPQARGFMGAWGQRREEVQKIQVMLEDGVPRSPTLQTPWSAIDCGCFGTSSNWD